MRKLERLTIMVYRRMPLFSGVVFAFQKHESSQRNDQRKQGKRGQETRENALEFRSHKSRHQI
jgi:hypothetical protein